MAGAADEEVTYYRSGPSWFMGVAEDGRARTFDASDDFLSDGDLNPLSVVAHSHAEWTPCDAEDVPQALRDAVQQPVRHGDTA